MQTFLIRVFIVFTITAALPSSAQMPVSIGGDLRGIVVEDGAALLAEGSSILRVPLTSPYAPVERLNLGQDILELQRHPSGLYALTEQGVFALNHAGDTILSFTPGGGQSMTIHNNWLTISAREAGVRLRQIQTDGSLTGTWQIDTPGADWQAVMTDNQLLAVADSGAGVRFYAFSEPDSLSSISTLLQISPAIQLAASGSKVFVADGQHHLHQVDVSTPTAPIVEGRYAPIRAVQKTILVDSWIIMADAVDGLKIYDAQTLRYVAGEIDHPALDVQQANHWIVGAYTDGLKIYDASRLPVLVETAVIPLWAQPTALAASENHIVAALGSQGLVIVTLNGFKTLAALSVRGTISDLKIQHGLAYLLLDDGRFLILDMTNFNAAQVASITEISGIPQRVHVNGSLALIASGAAGFYVFDVTNPAQPQRLALIPANEFAYDAWQLFQDSLLLLDGKQLRVISPQNFTELAVYPAVGRSLAVTGQLVVTAGENRIANFSAFGGNLTPLTTYAAPLDITSMQAQNGELVLSSLTPEAAVVRLDFSNPEHPHETAIYALPQGIKKFALQNADLITINSENRLTHWKINPFQAEFAGEYLPPAHFTGLHILDQTVYLLGNPSQQVIANTVVPLDLSAQIMAHTRNGYGVVDDNGRLTIYEGDAPVYEAENVTSLTASDDGFWFSDVGGNTFFVATSQPELKIEFKGHVTALAWQAGILYLGTHDGQVIAWQNGRMAAQQNNLGTVHRLTPLSNGHIAAAADDLWIFDSLLNQIRQIPLPDKTLAAAHSQDQLAVANGLCGIRLFSYPDLHEIGTAQVGYVSDVAFVNNKLWAIIGGKAVAFDMTAGELPLTPIAPYHPEVLYADNKVSELRWQPTDTACESAAYEVSFNGQPAVLVTESRYPLNTNIQKDLRWQVTRLTANGERIASPQWTLYTDYSGWAQSPQRFSDRLETEDRVSGLWILLGLLMLGMGMVGLANLLRRMFFPDKKQGA